MAAVQTQAPVLPLPLPPLDFVSAASPSSLMPISTATVDPNDPGFRTAWQNWTTSALDRLDQMPKLSQTQLDAIAGAAAGVDGSASNLGIDLPASLAALFEAKLTLDREKAKLVRMQKELKGYKDAAGNTTTIVAGQAVVAAATAAVTAQAHVQAQYTHQHDHTHLRDHAHPHDRAHPHDHAQPHALPHDHSHPHAHAHHHPHTHSHGTVNGNGKGKQVMSEEEEDYGECTCHE
jgi:hypothetical protein